jgi:hypothetical protein
VRKVHFETFPSQNARRPIAIVQSAEMQLQSEYYRWSLRAIAVA